MVQRESQSFDHFKFSCVFVEVEASACAETDVGLPLGRMVMQVALSSNQTSHNWTPTCKLLAADNATTVGVNHGLVALRRHMMDVSVL